MSQNQNSFQLLDTLRSSELVAVDDSASVKFELFLRSREMKQVVLYLEKAMLQQAKEREQFVMENKATVDSLMRVFMDNSNLSLEGMQLDDEAAQMSMQLAIDLRKSVSLINALFYEVNGLKS